ncbi:MAG TPA: hypothetical protein VK826_06460 [Bacteroidia bacterium]|nr:hypothetical protein [Bacteroidia bacterium]
MKEANNKSHVSNRSVEEWDLLPDAVKLGIEEGLRQADAGQGISHEEFKKKFSRWFNPADTKLKK